MPWQMMMTMMTMMTIATTMRILLRLRPRTKTKTKTKPKTQPQDPTRLHLNYGNMSVPALRQLAKERGLGGEDADLQKLKKKDLVQLLQ
jgi:hypothetical protein